MFGGGNQAFYGIEWFWFLLGGFKNSFSKF